MGSSNFEKQGKTKIGLKLESISYIAFGTMR